MSTAATRLLGLLGHPVGHSRSPAMMTFAFEQLGIDASYLAFDVPDTDALAAAIDGLWVLGAVGANVTVPHKLGALAHCGGRIDPLARAIGAANTLVRARDGRGFDAHNTDAPGAIAALESGAGRPVRGGNVTVLGAGGAARAVAVGAAAAGARAIVIVAREAERAGQIARAVTDLAGFAGTVHATALDAPDVPRAMARTDFVVQCTTVGMQGFAGDPDGHAQRALIALLDAAPPATAAMDLVYAPRQTPWLAAAQARALTPIDGLGMLAHQASLALSLWFGRTVPGPTLGAWLARAAR